MTMVYCTDTHKKLHSMGGPTHSWARPSSSTLTETPLMKSALPLRVVIAGILCLWGGHTAAAETKRPNILFLFADDWGRHASVYAQVDGPGGVNDVLQTPNFDRLARTGVLFLNAHVCAPSCTPCRSALLSGQYFWRTGRASILQGAVWDSAIPTYPLLLKQAGYHIGKSYKVWSPGTPVDAPYGGNQYAYEKAGRRFNKFSTHVTQMVGQGMAVEAAKQAIYDEVKANFQAFLADRKSGQPWCYWFGPTNTHRKWIKRLGQSIMGAGARFAEREDAPLPPGRARGAGGSGRLFGRGPGGRRVARTASGGTQEKPASSTTR